MPIVADEKDWTWVLSEPCHECGFDTSNVTPASVATAIPALLPRWQHALRGADATERPDDSTWSVAEYGAHVRDVFDVFTYRLNLMLTQENPTFANWDQDQQALDDDYASQDPETISVELVKSGQEAAVSFAAVNQNEWDRQGFRSNGSAFTVLTLAGYFLHDVMHHLHDVDA